jgi:hypothetical protein
MDDNQLLKKFPEGNRGNKAKNKPNKEKNI